MPAIVLDANLLVLLLVGMTRRDLIGKLKRVREYSPEDFDLLVETMQIATEIVVTPNTLTEASNLIGQIDGPLRTQVRETFRTFVESSQEHTVPSREAVGGPYFLRLGLTDETLLKLLADSARSLLTADLDLYLAATAAGADAVNFNHLRQASGLL